MDKFAYVSKFAYMQILLIVCKIIFAKRANGQKSP